MSRGEGDVQRRLAAIVSADVSGYARLMTHDDLATLRILGDYRARIGRIAGERHGRIVDSPGDNVLAEFASVVEAVRCAIEIQRELRPLNDRLPAERRMEFRIGIHLGDVIVEDQRIYGDGVNLAARMERLSEPGGVCISGAVFDQIRGQLQLRVENLGERLLKNVAEPMRAYRILLADDGDQATTTHGFTVDPEALTVSGFSGRPAIAVLAFDDLSPERDQEYFADGVCEDLIMLLSAWRMFPVIARNSSFTYKGRPVNVKQVSRELGVRYVVEGSLRRLGDRVRVAAQLIDATTGHHIWARRYDRGLEDIFAVQDDITEQIVASMHPELVQFESERAAREVPPRLDAWELAQRGWWHANRRSQADNRRAQELLRRAIELDARFVWAFYALAFSLSLDLFYQWSESPAKALAELVQLSQACAGLDSQDPHRHLAIAMGCSLTGRPEQALSAAQRAIELNPSLAWAHYLLGTYLAASGNPEEGIVCNRKAMRLSPQDPLTWIYLGAEASMHFVAARYSEVVDACHRVLQLRADWPNAYAMLATSHAHLGQLDRARTALKEMLRLQPGFTAAGFRLVYASAAPGIVERYVDGLVKAGLPPERA